MQVWLELADALDSKSSVQRWAWEFESPHLHKGDNMISFIGGVIIFLVGVLVGMFIEMLIDGIK
jgi:hypothetical protein